MIERLIEAVNSNDKERVQSFFAQDVMFRGRKKNKDSIGLDAVWEKIGGLHNRADEIEWDVARLEEDGQGAVLTDGSIRYLVNGEWLKFSASGTFEVKGSKITQWL